MRLLPIFVVLLAACPGKCPDPQYEGKATDEAYLSLIDGEARATADAMKAPVLDVADGAQLPAMPINTFRWTSTITATAPSPRYAPVRPLPERKWWRELLVSEAWAHLPPVTGAIYWFKITVPGQACPVELVSTRNEWTPTAEIWTTLTSGTGARTVNAQSAYLTENRITEGPYKLPAPSHFSVSP